MRPKVSFGRSPQAQGSAGATTSSPSSPWSSPAHQRAVRVHAVPRYDRGNDSEDDLFQHRPLPGRGAATATPQEGGPGEADVMILLKARGSMTLDRLCKEMATASSRCVSPSVQSTQRPSHRLQPASHWHQAGPVFRQLQRVSTHFCFWKHSHASLYLLPLAPTLRPRGARKFRDST